MASAFVTDPLDRRLLDDWQRDFPLTPRPFAEIGAALGLEETEVIDRLARMRDAGRITRVGGTCAPNTVSASTLAAVSAPPERVEEVAAIIGAEPGVNHSYLREHKINLWFVATGPDRAHVDAALARVRSRSGLTVLDLRLVRPFNVDLGFSLGGDRAAVPPPRQARPEAMAPGDRRILQALTTGLPLVTRPYAEIAGGLGRQEGEVLDRIRVLQEAGVIARHGVIVRHRALGWRANAMVVWDIAPERIDAAGPRLAAHRGVTLCYERQPAPGVWPYRLYAMIHARSRSEALEVLSAAAALPELTGAPYRVLFSLRCFKQTGALISLKEGNAA
jgi:DNA-binding Lrp family transcriptional regulator